ncbi:MAG: MarR family transcriptional regulator [Sphingobacteriales bacterium]|nr:MAG: MarR family transcriptional regulator [Sphingobacteriales bacterium]
MTSEKFGTYSYLLDRTSRRIKQFATQRFKEANFDITVDQWHILKHLDIDNVKNQSDLAELTGKDHPTITRIIDLLCKKNLTERKPHPKDRRSFLVTLTEEGQNTVKQLTPLVATIRMKAWENLSEHDYNDLKRILDTIYQTLEI